MKHLLVLSNILPPQIELCRQQSSDVSHGSSCPLHPGRSPSTGTHFFFLKNHHPLFLAVDMATNRIKSRMIVLLIILAYLDNTSPIFKLFENAKSRSVASAEDSIDMKLYRGRKQNMWRKIRAMPSYLRPNKVRCMTLLFTNGKSYTAKYITEDIRKKREWLSYEHDTCIGL